MNWYPLITTGLSLAENFFISTDEREFDTVERRTKTTPRKSNRKIPTRKSRMMKH